MSVTRAELQAISQQIYLLLSDMHLAKDIKLERATQLIESLHDAADPASPSYLGYSGLDSQDAHHFMFFCIQTFRGPKGERLTLELVMYCDQGIIRALKVNTPI